MKISAQPSCAVGVQPVAMKHPYIPGILCAALLLCGGSPAFSNPPGSGDGPESWGPGPGKPPGKHGRPGGAPELSPDEMQRLAAARTKAKSDPTIRSLKESRDAIDNQLENAMNAAILAVDPGLAPALEKIKQARGRAKEAGERFQTLTPEQQEALKAARQAAKADPAVVAATEKMKAASDPKAKHQAGRAIHEAMKAAMLKQNPALAPLLEKMGPPPGGPKGHGRGPGGPEEPEGSPPPVM